MSYQKACKLSATKSIHDIYFESPQNIILNHSEGGWKGQNKSTFTLYGLNQHYTAFFKSECLEIRVKFDLLSKLFGIYFNHIIISPQNFGKSSTHQKKSPYLEVSILGYGFSVRSDPHILKNSNISTTDEGMFKKF